MATKTISTRIKNRLDTYSNWATEGVELLPGEIALVKVNTQAVDDVTGAITTVPAFLMKVGDTDENGETKPFSALPWLSAKAADVHAWAKMQNTSDIPVSISTGSGDTVSTTSDTLGNWLKNIKISKDAADLASAEVAQLSEQLAKTLEALTETETGTGPFITSVVQSNGKITTTRGTITEEHIPELTVSKIIFTPEAGTQTKVMLDEKLSGIDADISDLKSKQSGHTDAEIETFIENKLTTLTASDPLVPESDNTSMSFIDSISQTNGVLTATKKKILLGADGGAAKYEDYADLKSDHDELSAEVSNLKSTLAGGVRFLGIALQPALSESSNLIYPSILLNGTDVWTQAVLGDIVIQGSKEYIWTGAKWEELGDLTRIGALEEIIADMDFPGLSEDLSLVQAEVSTLSNIGGNYLRFSSTDNKVYVGSNGAAEITFDCGGAEDFI